MMPRLNNENGSVILGFLPGGLSQPHVATQFNVAGSTIHVSMHMQPLRKHAHAIYSNISRL